MLNVILHREWEDIEQDIPLSDDVMQTVMGHSTSMTSYLELAKATERLDLDEMKRICKEVHIPMEELCVYSQEAMRWGRQLD